MNRWFFLCILGLSGCASSLPLSIVQFDTDDTEDTASSATLIVDGQVTYNNEARVNVAVGLVHASLYGDWEGDVPMVADSLLSDQDGRFTLSTNQLGSYWVLAELGTEESTGLLVAAERLELEDWGSTTVVDLSLEPISSTPTAGDECSCEYYWSDMAYSCCPTSDGEECSWLWDICLSD